MKKLVTFIITMVMAMTIIVSVIAESNTELKDKIDRWLEETEELNNVYCWKVDEYGVYCISGVIDKTAFEDVGFDDWGESNVKENFAAAYIKLIEEKYPDYQDVNVEIYKVGVYEGTNIWHVLITSKTDMIDYVEGNQTKISAITAF